MDLLKAEIENITENLTGIKKEYDSAGLATIEEREKHYSFVDAMEKSGKYTPVYIAEIRKNFKPTFNSASDAEKRKNNIKEFNEHYARLENIVKSRLNAPIRPEISNKLTTYKALNMSLSNADIDLLCMGANYSEMQLIAHYAKTRTEEAIKTGIDAETGTTIQEKYEKVNPYILDVPTTERILQELNNFRMTAHNFINNYSGADCELLPYCNVDKLLTGAAGSYFKNNSANELIKFLETTGIIQPDAEPTITETEKKLLDVAMELSLTDYGREKLLERLKQDKALADILTDYKYQSA